MLENDNPPENVLNGHYIAFRICTEGKNRATNYMFTSPEQTVGKEGDNKPAKRCGLSTILSYLCYQDKEEDHSIKGSGIGYDFSLELATPDRDKKQAVGELKRHAEKNCQRIIKIVTCAFPTVGGRAYLYAAMDAGYNSLLVLEKGKKDFTSFKTAKLSEDFQKEANRPTKKGSSMIKDPVLDPFIEKYGTDWFFCKGALIVRK